MKLKLSNSLQTMLFGVHVDLHVSDDSVYVTYFSCRSSLLNLQN